MNESLPSSEIATRMAEAMQGIAQANANYLQELFRANAALFTAFMDGAANNTGELPSESARHRRAAAPDYH